MNQKLDNRDKIEDVLACIREGIVYYAEETGYGEINIKFRIYNKEGLLQVDVDRGPNFRFFIEREEVLSGV